MFVALTQTIYILICFFPLTNPSSHFIVSQLVLISIQHALCGQQLAYTAELTATLLDITQLYVQFRVELAVSYVLTKIR